jgi:hypothetical protein
MSQAPVVSAGRTCAADAGRTSAVSLRSCHPCRPVSGALAASWSQIWSQPQVALPPPHQLWPNTGALRCQGGLALRAGQGECRPMPSDLGVRADGCQHVAGARTRFAPDLLRSHGSGWGAMPSAWLCLNMPRPRPLADAAPTGARLILILPGSSRVTDQALHGLILAVVLGPGVADAVVVVVKTAVKYGLLVRRRPKARRSYVRVQPLCNSIPPPWRPGGDGAQSGTTPNMTGG